MDGNRRWARQRNVSTEAGHKAGFNALKNIAKEFPRLKKEYGLEYVNIYAFSTENWKRDPEEVSYLLALFEEGMNELSAKLDEINVRVRVIGDLRRFPEHLQKKLLALEEKTLSNTEGTVAFALSYGGRAELVDSINRMISQGKEVTEEDVSKVLWTNDIPDPDIIIRTSGEHRLSNFLPWQSVYSEFFFPETLWPDFTVQDLEGIFAEYYTRERRRGT